MRRRVTWLAVLVSAVAVALFAVPLAFAVARYLAADERSELQRGAATIAAAVTGDLSRSIAPLPKASEPGQQVSVYDVRGRRVSGDGPLGASPLARRAVTGTADTGVERGRTAAAVPVSDGDTVIGAVLLTAARGQLRQRVVLAWTSMLGLAAVAVGTAALLARGYARRLAAPVEALADTAARVGAGDLAARAAPTGVAELDTLGAAMNRSAERLHDTLRRERAFSADASHQLRTPLTGLRLELEAALADPGTDPRPAMTAALRTTDRLEATIATLLDLARDAHSPDAVTVVTLTEAAHRHWHGPLAARGRPLRIVTTTVAGQRVMASRPAVEQILDVLLDNAARHGRGAVTITVREAGTAVALDVADEGPPVALDPGRLFQRRQSGAGGHGIGLALARTLAEADGGRLLLNRASPPTFTLFLRAAGGAAKGATTRTHSD